MTLQLGDALAQRTLLVGLPEEARVVEAGAQHALVAVADDARRIALGVEHGQKMRRQPAARVLHREIFLVVAHHGDQHFFRQLEEFAIEVAEDHRGPLRQIDDRVEQFLVFAPARAGNGAGGGVQRFADALLALAAAAQSP